ncbi:Protein CBR-CFI-1 [Caenorhabditis briggsae]|uniref:Protein CBR-CFI-1 n=1 Tax=Caenorhabditis briggsae TaxID=6238 RepID=A8WWQ1_CAEBR|nr:Protein CBR-CFI-1 [Caenorhabditis briggsae]CAP24614.2 Protein CBR-CFI-1 [Caenorhabditis briggsae]
MSVRIDEPQLFVSMSKEPTQETVNVGAHDETSSNCDERPDDQIDEQKSTPPGSPDLAANLNMFDMESRQKVVQRLIHSQLNLSNLRTPLNLPPIFQALQGPFNIQQQLLGLASGLTAISPGLDDYDEENTNGVEPEDLTLGGFRKENSVKSDEPSESGVNASGGPAWSYEEQFKQLYELSDDVKRKEWLDDWLNFMHRIGKPVTRIPIMAKQVLDLYELYRLVVQHGGLVEIINKKLWREITKGLNLPSSITSAAFTLRTQYQKYLYDYECEKEKLSNQSDLQQAIDGNRREAPGRRTAPSFPLPFQLPHAANAAASMLNKQLNGLGMRNDLLDDENTLSLQASGLFGAGYGAEQMAMLEAHQRNMERAQRVVEQAARQSLGLTANSNGNGGNHSNSGRESTSSNDSDIPGNRFKTLKENNLISVKRAKLEIDHKSNSNSSLRISTKTSDDSKNSMTVSMEINGITYQGILFAQDEAISES